MIDRNKHFPVRHFGGHWAIGHWPRLEAVIEYVRSLLLTHSPARITKQWVDDMALGWTTYVSHMPDGAEQDNVIVFYDDGVRVHGKDRDANVPEHFVVSMRIRQRAFGVGQSRFETLLRFLDTVQDVTVTVGARTYEIVTASMVGCSYTGHDAQRRSTFDLTYSMNMYEIVQA